MRTTVFRFPTTALPVQVQRDYLSYTDIGAAPPTRPAKLLEIQTLGKARRTLRALMESLFRMTRKIQLKYLFRIPSNKR